MSRVIEVRTPGRLHFGLSSFGGSGRQFSGVGLMVDGAGVTLRAAASNSFSAHGLHQPRVLEFAQRFSTYHQLPILPSCKLEVITSPPDHVGLGIGTQLGLAVVAALSEWIGTNWRDATLLTQVSGRGRRSAIGTHGFLRGGLLVDAGKLSDEPLGQLATRVDVPTSWRIVLIRQPAAHGLSGPAETQAISSLPPVPMDVTRNLQAITENRILPSLQVSNFEAFGSALYDYGHLAGECFAAAQGGPFASPAIAALVEHIRELGYVGVGQSSWGPTVFAVAADQRTAEQLVSQLSANPNYANHHYTITQANNSGANVEDISLGH